MHTTVCPPVQVLTLTCAVLLKASQIQEDHFLALRKYFIIPKMGFIYICIQEMVKKYLELVKK